MALFSKVFSRLSKSRATGGTIRRCYSGVSCPPPELAVEELKNRHGFGPWLMFADAENDKRGGEGLRRCYSFSSGEIFSLPAPRLQGRRCWGTQYGWLITFGPYGVMDLFNPLNHHQLPLPPRRTIRTSNKVSDDRRAFFESFALSSNPSDSDSLDVMSTYGGCLQLAFTSPGDKAWKYLNDSGSRTAKSDAIFYKGQFYSINCRGKLKVCDITSGKPREKHITTFAHSSSFDDEFYLVEISGHLHLICREYVDCETSKTGSFDIYRFDFQETKWVAIEDLNNHTLFVGNNTTFAISASDYPGIKPNCIYFTDDYILEYHLQVCDMGVYDFATKILVETFIKGDNSPYSRFCRPFFFIPSLSHL